MNVSSKSIEISVEMDVCLAKEYYDFLILIMYIICHRLWIEPLHHKKLNKSVTANYYLSLNWVQVHVCHVRGCGRIGGPKEFI